MDISNDKEAYLLSKILGELDSENAGTDFLRKYWIMSGKLKYTQKLLGETFSFAEDETQYLLNVENLCQRLMLTLNAFLREPYCSDTQVEIEIEPTVQQVSAELIIEFENLQTMSLDYGWKMLVELFSKIVCQIESIISRLMAMQASGKHVCFYTNARAEHFLSASQIDFRHQSDRYFIPKH